MKQSTYEKYCLIVDEWFVNGFNGTKAYQKFYPESKEDTCATEFLRILRIPKIKDYETDKQNKAKLALETSHDKLLEELRNWAYSDITETLMLSPEQVKKLPIEIRRLITKFKTTTRSYTVGDVINTETVVELWFVSKERAMEMIHKHTGFYEKDNKDKANKTTNVINLGQGSNPDESTT